MAQRYTTPQGTYRVIQQTGDGYYGLVYLAQAERTGAPVTIKRFRSESLYQSERSAQEQITALGIVGIPRLLDAADDALVLVLESVVDGHNVVTIPERSLPPNQVIDCILQLFTIVWQLHDNGIVHGDIKDQNLVLGENGLHLVDFGSATYSQVTRQSFYEYHEVCMMVVAAQKVFALAEEQEEQLALWLEDEFLRVTSAQQVTAASVLAGWQDVLKEREAR